MKINITKLHKDAVIPKYSHGFKEDAAMDLVSVETSILYPGEFTLFKTGIAIELPPYSMGRIAPRSGLAYDHGITVLNADGVIDPAYRGDVGVILINHGYAPYRVEKGDRIAQLIVERYEPVEWNVVYELDEDTGRGSGGFGHTGR